MTDQTKQKFLDAMYKSDIATAADEFRQVSNASVFKNYYATGFASLDRALGGGIPDGLTIVGALSGLGKTTIMMQIMNQLADGLTPGIVFSLEMSRVELTAKEISRRTFINTGGDLMLSRTARDLMSRDVVMNLSAEAWDVVEEAKAQMGFGAKLTIVEQQSKPITAENICTYVRNWMTFNPGEKPVVLVDYLQILEPEDPKTPDIQAINHSLKLLHTLAKDLGIAIIAISAINRAGYDEPIDRKAFKGSGGIEYSADVLIGMELHGVGGGCIVEREMASDVRAVDLVILKNRFGGVNQRIEFRFYTPFNHFDCLTRDEEKPGKGTPDFPYTERVLNLAH